MKIFNIILNIILIILGIFLVGVNITSPMPEIGEVILGTADIILGFGQLLYWSER